MKPTAGQQHALDLLGDRWTLWLLVAIEERTGSRFSDLATQPGLSRRVLAERLERLVDERLLQRIEYQARPVRHRYALTDRGRSLRRIATLLLHVGGGGTLATTDVHVAFPEPEPAAPAPHVPDTDADTHPADRLLESDPDAAWAIFCEALQPLVRYDDQYRTPLVETLATWLGCDASVSVTAARLYAHRHTIRYRLARVTELTGLDVDATSDRERLQLGLRAMRLFERTGRDLLAP